MDKDLRADIKAFQDLTGLSDHRVGMVLAGNGRLIERIEDERRFWPETVEGIKKALNDECAKRSIKINRDAV